MLSVSVSLFLRTEAGGPAECCLCSVPSALFVPAFHFLLPVSPAHKGRRHLGNVPPDSDPQQVPGLCTASLGLPGEGKHDQPPTGCVCPALWSLVSSRYTQEAAARFFRGPLMSFTHQQTATLGRAIFSLQLLKAQPCHAHVGSLPRGPPGRSNAWTCL